MAHLGAPGVKIEQAMVWQPAPALRTGVPAFLGLVSESELYAYQQPSWLDAGGAAVQDVWLRQPEGGLLGLLSRAGVQRWTRQRPQSPHAAAQSSDPALAERSILLAHPHPAPSAPAAPDELELPAFTAWPQFEAAYGGLTQEGYLDHAVRGFFENGGSVCFVLLVVYAGYSQEDALRFGLDQLEMYDDFDLVCVPDIMRFAHHNPAQALAMQNAVLDHCAKLGDRFALLDALPGAGVDTVLEQRRGLAGTPAHYGALYFPWIRVISDDPAAARAWFPPCGHVAGIYARSDTRTGIHKAPANEELAGVVDLAVVLTDREQGPLNAAGINCLRAFPRRGIRVWGARTLSDDPQWRYVNVLRIFLTATRWIERNLTAVVFEPHTPQLWARIVRDLTVYFTGLLERGAFPGHTAATAFYVKCDAETNPQAIIDLGLVMTEIGLAAAAPAEFIVVRILHGPTGARMLGPDLPPLLPLGAGVPSPSE